MKNPRPKSEESIAKIELEYTYEIKLPSIGEQPLVNFAEVLEVRKSSRDFGPISIFQLSEVLFLSSRVKVHVTNENGYVLNHKPFPSAGARHPIDIFISSKTLFQNNKLLFYDGDNHVLKALNIDENVCTQLMTHLLESFPNSEEATIIWFIAFPQKTAAKYDNYESLIWRDIGALANTIHLTCTFFGLNSCISGTLGYPYISKIFEGYTIQSGGAILIGSKTN